MRLRVDLLPHGNYPDVVLVVDVLRATTTAVTYLERGADALLLTATPEVALGLRGEAAEGKLVLGGERGGLPIPGFDFGNSPVEAAAQNFTGRVVVMNTTNGTGAAHTAAQTGKHVLLAALTNAHAAARRARALASEEIAIVCAGTDARVGLEDVYAAGVLAEYLLAMGEFGIDDGTRIALTVRRNAGNPIEALSSSGHGQHLVSLGLGDDVRYAAQVSTSTVVPILDAVQETPEALRFVVG
ncbi:2-phosphosulfolactate phosphatase [Deinococcus metallilatus]|uniref:Probable 2-phosphosulfolactate phosphatase n=1 Tax=Deinococcus metallilatus TaxID=1211322 RepID=A0AAJ5F178_9DEIO|nr:2-phosphosulfolactate phosphatase [Deinococcus metallilatus]QBY08398.1 2-phosphosulfolactate phosphatase [Deinococcus metallilatus]RXJ11197.1 2-phosphosulfolactate phosphatase [Deinococcus metallilatus]TLK24688.1 2-phosphosulfolactate phosphatase [Deinococcus metallilatus]GMA17496.1 putative 2-phosphosulfolactate phosphatase [Deinococcus metallilatus]